MLYVSLSPSVSSPKLPLLGVGRGGALKMSAPMCPPSCEGGGGGRHCRLYCSNVLMSCWSARSPFPIVLSLGGVGGGVKGDPTMRSETQKFSSLLPSHVFLCEGGVVGGGGSFWLPAVPAVCGGWGGGGPCPEILSVFPSVIPPPYSPIPWGGGGGVEGGSFWLPAVPAVGGGGAGGLIDRFLGEI